MVDFADIQANLFVLNVLKNERQKKTVGIRSKKGNKTVKAGYRCNCEKHFKVNLALSLSRI